MSKHQPFDIQLAQIFSSSELVIFYSVFIYSLYNLNVYSSLLFIIIVLKTVIIAPIKNLFKSHSIGKRPKGALNCNMFNCGGYAHSGGMPSGHMVLLGILSSIVYNIYKINNNINSIYIYLIIVVTTGLSRYYLNCHTIPQVILGYVLGIILGITYYFIDQEISKYIKRYKDDKEEFYNSIS